MRSSWGVEEMSFGECDYCNYPRTGWNDDIKDEDDCEGDEYDWETNDVENMGLNKEAYLANNEK